MKRSEIKVGETYGVRHKFSERDDCVPAVVLGLDDPCEWVESGRGWSPTTLTRKGGGVRVRFVKPTRYQSYSNFYLATKANENAGEIVEEFVFHEDRENVPIGRCFVGVWSEMEAERVAGENAHAEYLARQMVRAEEFAPELEELRALFEKVGVDPDVIQTYNSGEYPNEKPTSFNDRLSGIRFGLGQLRQLVEIAAKHGEKVVS